MPDGDQATQEAAEPVVPVSFRIKTYWKRTRSNPGLTSIESQRLDIAAAFNWLLREIPKEAVQVVEDDKSTMLLIDWDLVPPEIRNGP